MSIMEDKKKISIIIPCYNVSDYLERCWQSLKRQTIGLDSLECIFINDASDDDGKTMDLLKGIESQARDSVLVIDLDKNGGPGNARNIGIEYANGKYIQFLDSDDELRDDACMKLYETAEKNTSDIIQFNHLYILEDQRKSSYNSKQDRLYVIENGEDRIPFLNASLVTYGCTNKFYKKDLILETDAKFPIGLRYEEPLFVYPMFLYAKRVYLLNDDLYLYYFRPDSMVTSQLGKRLLDHPRVQLMLLEYCMARSDIYEEYKEIIEIYFLWSFYCETMSFAADYSDAFLPFEFFKFMQEACRSFFPYWRENRFIGMIPEVGQTVLSSINVEFKDQNELDIFLTKIKGKI